MVCYLFPIIITPAHNVVFGKLATYHKNMWWTDQNNFGLIKNRNEKALNHTKIKIKYNNVLQCSKTPLCPIFYITGTYFDVHKSLYKCFTQISLENFNINCFKTFSI